MNFTFTKKQCDLLMLALRELEICFTNREQYNQTLSEVIALQEMINQTLQTSNESMFNFLSTIKELENK